MCEICNKLDLEHKNRVDEIFSRISEQITNSKKLKENKEDEYTGAAFSTEAFPKVYGLWLEPRMQLQIPSNFYQSIIIDNQKLRNDWASGWLRVVSFQESSLLVVAHGFTRKEDKEFNLFHYQIEFKKEEYKASMEQNKIVIRVNDVKKEVIDLLSEEKKELKLSFTFIHTPTDNAFVPKNRIEHSGLFQSVYKGKISPKPVTFDWSSYVITVPHFAFHSILHQRYKEFGFTSAIEMQHKVTECLRVHLGLV